MKLFFFYVQTVYYGNIDLVRSWANNQAKVLKQDLEVITTAIGTSLCKFTAICHVK